MKQFPLSVYPVLFTNNSYWLQVASDLGIRCSNDYLCIFIIPFIVRSNEFGTPYFSSLLSSLESLSRSTFVGYVNCDLLFHSSFFESLHTIDSLQSQGKLEKKGMMMGRRYNLNTNIRNNWTSFHRDQFDQLLVRETEYSDLFISVAQDYFIYNRGSIDLSLLPDLVIGRNGYDNYMVDFCMKNQIALIDLSLSTIVLHQTDADGNWAGGERPSKDKTWNLDLVGMDYDYESVSRAPYQLLHYQDGSYNLHTFAGYDNDFSLQEMEFISSYFPDHAQCNEFNL